MAIELTTAILLSDGAMARAKATKHGDASVSVEWRSNEISVRFDVENPPLLVAMFRRLADQIEVA